MKVELAMWSMEGVDRAGRLVCGALTMCAIFALGACAASRRDGTGAAVDGGTGAAADDLAVCAGAGDQESGVLAFAGLEDPEVPGAYQMVAMRAVGEVEVLGAIPPATGSQGAGIVQLPPDGAPHVWYHCPADCRTRPARVVRFGPGEDPKDLLVPVDSQYRGVSADGRLLWIGRRRVSAFYDLRTGRVVDLPLGVRPPTVRPERFERVDGWTPALMSSAEIGFVNQAGELRTVTPPEGRRFVFIDSDGRVSPAPDSSSHRVAAIPWRGRWVALSTGDRPEDGVWASVISPDPGEPRRDFPMPAPREIRLVESSPTFLALYPPVRPDVTLGPVAVFDPDAERFIRIPALETPRRLPNYGDDYHRPRLQDERLVFGRDRLLAVSLETGTVETIDAAAPGALAGTELLPSPTYDDFGSVALGPGGELAVPVHAGPDSGLTVGPPDGPRRRIGRPVFGVGEWRVAPLGPGAWYFEVDAAAPFPEDATVWPGEAAPDAVPLGTAQIIPADPDGPIFVTRAPLESVRTDPTGRCAVVHERRTIEGDSQVVQHLVDLRSGKTVTLDRTWMFAFAGG